MLKSYLDKLENRGVVVLNDQVASPTSTVVVVGLPRSGTSFVASSLNHLDVFLGEKAFPPTYEDKALKDPFDSGDAEGFADVVKRYDERYDLWAMKLPRVSYRIADAIGHLRSPRLIVTFRDPLSVQIRKQISQGSRDILKGIQEVMDGYRELVSQLSSLDVPILMISYDKAAADPEFAIGEIARFCGLHSSAHQQALASVRSDSRRYLDEARVEKAYGVVEVHEDNVVSGWAIHQDVIGKESPTLEITVDSRPVEYRVEQRDRSDLAEKPSEYFDERGIRKVFVNRNLRAFENKIGFVIHLPEKPRGVLRLRVRGDRFPFYEREFE